MAIHLVTVVGGNGWETLEPMLHHYRSLGIESFLVSLHLSRDDDPAREPVEEITRRFGCGLFATVVGDHNLVEQEMYVKPRREYPRDWFVLADSDEFQVYSMPLPDLAAECERRNWDYAHGCFIDRVAADGSLPPMDPARPIAEQYPWGAALTQVLLGGDPRKATLVHGAVLVLRGQHLAPYSSACPPEVSFTQVHHYKWRAGVELQLQRRLEVWRRHGEERTADTLRALEYLEQHGNRLDLSDPALLAAPCEPEYRFWEQVRAAAIAMPRQ